MAKQRKKPKGYGWPFDKWHGFHEDRSDKPLTAEDVRLLEAACEDPGADDLILWNSAPKKPAKPSKPLDKPLTPEVLAQFVGVSIGELPQGIDPKPTQMYLFAEGLYRVVNTPVGRVVAKVVGWTDKSLPPKPANFAEGFSFGCPKIPAELLLQTISFFKAVNAKHKAEAFVSLWLKDGEYHIHVPEQDVSGAKVRHEQDYNPEGAAEILQIHSHNTMQAFWSSVDDADESCQGNRCYGVIGKIEQPIPMSKWRVKAGQAFYDIRLVDLFEFPDYEINHVINGADLFTMDGSADGITKQPVSWDPTKDIGFPAEWLEQIVKPQQKPLGGTCYDIQGKSYSSNFGPGGGNHQSQSESIRTWWEDAAIEHLKDLDNANGRGYRHLGD